MTSENGMQSEIQIFMGNPATIKDFMSQTGKNIFFLFIMHLLDKKTNLQKNIIDKLGCI